MSLVLYTRLANKWKDLHDLVATFINNEAGVDNEEEVEEDKEEEEEGNDEIFLHFVDDTLKAGSSLPKYPPLASMTSNIVEVDNINTMVEQAKKQISVRDSSARSTVEFLQPWLPNSHYVFLIKSIPKHIYIYTSEPGTVQSILMFNYLYYKKEKRLELSIRDWVQVSKGLYSKALSVVQKIQEGDCDKLKEHFPDQTFKVVLYKEFLFNGYTEGLCPLDSFTNLSLTQDNVQSESNLPNITVLHTDIQQILLEGDYVEVKFGQHRGLCGFIMLQKSIDINMYDVMQTTLSTDIAELKYNLAIFNQDALNPFVRQDILIQGNTGAARHTKGLTAYVLYGFGPENRIRKFNLLSLVSLDNFGYLGGDKELEQNKILNHPEVYSSLQKKRKAVNLLLSLLQTFQRLVWGKSN
ncbi:uncharacterized protein FOMMEDRAFT_25086 [Fomitiporia mediterranea MF3/22]|uniref:uncharacterized protein n=1 Tax=Fomitiporia mediterranea (strain MF3/22) TaxID=694068 RepID=UPI0004407DEC|nr:uncharacterized protein FOMMEDRAFT_25086 [Fomitiporia mediterranea MF3/22]EJD07816.1 hypothetical protein FOMMEDRAFT_25086 [Fomitiporia mediterranea MF3/22]